MENEPLIKAVMLLAFESGRNYEQIYQSLDLYNSVNFSDLEFAKTKGAMFDVGEIDFENVLKAKYSQLTDIEHRKFIQLEKLKNSVDELFEKFLR